MSMLLDKLLGTERLQGGDVLHWSVHWTQLKTPFHVLLFVMAAAGACYAILWFYKREPAYCPQRRKYTLAALRAAGVFILLVILAGPVLEMVTSGVSRSKVVLLVDTSQSMARQDHYANAADKLIAAHVLNAVPLSETSADRIPRGAEETIATANRMALVRALLKHKEIGLLEKLQRDYDLEVWTFGRAADMANLSAESGKLDGTILDAVEASGAATEIGGALRATMNRLKGQPLAGIVLITDGGWNRGENPTLTAADLPVRVLPIGIGVPEAKDIAINHVFMESKIFIDDPAPLYVRLKHHGFSGEQSQIVVSMDNGEELARQPVTLRKGGEQTEVLRVKPKKAGKFTFRIEVPPSGGDCEPTNNVKERQVEVIDKKIKVLILESVPRWEYRFLSTALLRDRRVDCKIYLRVPDLPELATPGSHFIKEFPSKEELFKYDVLVFGNLANDSSWTEEQLEHIKRFVVGEGGGIWFIAGKNHFPDTYRDSKLEALVPVEFDRMPEVGAEDERNNPLTEGFRLALTPEGRSHSLTRLDPPTGGGSDEDNSSLWDLMPPIFWYHKAVRAKKGASVLLVHSGEGEAALSGSRGEPAPLLVTVQVGRGRVLYSATSDFWRMRFPAELGPDALARFYGHAVQYLGLAHCLGGTPRIEINTDAQEYAVGDPIKVTARILNKDTFEPSDAKTYHALSSSMENDAQTQALVLTLEPGQRGMYRGELAAKEQGNFRITLRDEQEEGACKNYSVRIPQIELDSPDMKKELLDNIAKASIRGAVEGKARMFFADEAGEVAKELKETQRRQEARLEDPLWDAPLMLILFTLCMGAEWFVRKRSDLC